MPAPGSVDRGMTWMDCSNMLPNAIRDAGVAYVYRYLDVQKHVLYVGVTTNHPAVRAMGHSTDRRQAWFSQAVAYQAASVPLTDAYVLEAELIHANHPQGNRHCPVSGCTFYPTPTMRGAEGSKRAATARRANPIPKPALKPAKARAKRPKIRPKPRCEDTELRRKTILETLESIPFQYGLNALTRELMSQYPGLFDSKDGTKSFIRRMQATGRVVTDTGGMFGPPVNQDS